MHSRKPTPAKPTREPATTIRTQLSSLACLLTSAPTLKHYVCRTRPLPRTLVNRGIPSHSLSSHNARISAWPFFATPWLHLSQVKRPDRDTSLVMRSARGRALSGEPAAHEAHGIRTLYSSHFQCTTKGGRIVSVLETVA